MHRIANGFKLRVDTGDVDAIAHGAFDHGWIGQRKLRGVTIRILKSGLAEKRSARRRRSALAACDRSSAPRSQHSS